MIVPKGEILKKWRELKGDDTKKNKDVKLGDWYGRKRKEDFWEGEEWAVQWSNPTGVFLSMVGDQEP